jgi:homoserine dehydrogenase
MKVAMIGLGSVGRGVAGMVAQKRPGITVTGIADSKGGRIDSDGVDLFEVLEKKQKTGSCGDKKI